MIDPALVYEKHAQGVRETEFWKQVRRTTNGEPFPEEQIDLIVQRCRSLLNVEEDDVFLDLCCGNGALTALVFEGCARGVCVDAAATLIKVAQTHFSRPGFEYVEADVVAWAETAPDVIGATKALLYGSVNFLPPTRTPALLKALADRFPTLDRLLVGNIADRDRLHDFFSPETYSEGVEDDPASPIGYWWSKDAFADMAVGAGWRMTAHAPPTTFIASHYRFDALLERAPRQ